MDLLEVTESMLGTFSLFYYSTTGIVLDVVVDVVLLDRWVVYMPECNVVQM